MSTSQSFWARVSLPMRVGLAFAAAGIALAIVGILRGNVPARPISIFLALLISGGSWGVVSWAVATAVVDVERDVAEATIEDPDEDPVSSPTGKEVPFGVPVGAEGMPGSASPGIAEGEGDVPEPASAAVQRGESPVQNG